MGPLPPTAQHRGIMAVLSITVILWAILSGASLLIFLVTFNVLALIFSGAFGVGAWWVGRILLAFHAEQASSLPERQHRSHHRHAQR